MSIIHTKYLSGLFILALLFTCVISIAQTNKIEKLKNDIEAAEKSNSYTNTIDSKLALFHYYDSTNNYSDQIPLCKDLLADKKFVTTPEALDVMLELIGCYQRSQDYSNVIELLEVIKTKQKKLGKSPAYIQKEYHGYIAMMHYQLKNYDEAATNFKLSFPFASDLSALAQASILNNIGLCYFKNNQYDSAQYYYDKGLFKISESEYTTNYYYHFENVMRANAAAILTAKGQYAEALPFYFKELEYCDEYKEFHIIYGAYYRIAESYYYLKKPEKALEYIDSFENYKWSNPNIFTEINLYRLKGKCLLSIGQNDAANISFKRSQGLSDSTEIKRQNEVFAKAVSQYKTKQQDVQLALYNQKITIGERTSLFQRVALGILAISLLALILFYRRTRLDRKTIALQKQKVEKSLKEKETLLKEIHHRIKNNLQMVSGLLDIQAIKMDDPKFEEVLTDSQRYINSMALVHQMLYQTHNASTVSISEYITDLTSETLRGLGENDLSPNFNVISDEFKIEQAIPLGLILCELITNTYKHAYTDKAGDIRISLTHQNNQFTFLYRDFGRGIDDNLDNQAEGVGQNLITLFAEEIGASLNIKNENGLEYLFTFTKL